MTSVIPEPFASGRRFELDEREERVGATEWEGRPVFRPGPGTRAPRGRRAERVRPGFRLREASPLLARKTHGAREAFA